MNLLWFILIGLAGFFAGVMVKGRGIGLLGNLLVGIIGALVGGLMLSAVGVISPGLIGNLISALIGAAAMLVLIGFIKRKGG